MKEVGKQIFLILQLGVIFGCQKQSSEVLEVVSSPLEKTQSKYENPEIETGFSPNDPIGHCVVLTGYNQVTMKAFLSDPADNLAVGHKMNSKFEPLPVQMVGKYCTIKIGGKIATVTGAVVITPPTPQRKTVPLEWIQDGMPDFSQHAATGWNCYCAPTSAANVIIYFSKSFTEFQIGSIYEYLSQNEFSEDWKINKLIGGNREPFPVRHSLAYRMKTSLQNGTTMAGIQNGMEDFIDDHSNNPDQWKVDLLLENEFSPNGKKLWDSLVSHCASGDGILLCVMWGVPNLKGSGDNLSDQDSSEALPKDGQNFPKDQSELSDPVEHSIYSKEYPEEKDLNILNPKREDFVDEKKQITDDFNIFEKNGIWFEKRKRIPFTGKAKRSYPNGAPLLEISYKDGLKDGTQTIWGKNGEILREITWRKGEKVN